MDNLLEAVAALRAAVADGERPDSVQTEGDDTFLIWQYDTDDRGDYALLDINHILPEGTLVELVSGACGEASGLRVYI